MRRIRISSAMFSEIFIQEFLSKSYARKQEATFLEHTSTYKARPNTFQYRYQTANALIFGTAI